MENKTLNTNLWS